MFHIKKLTTNLMVAIVFMLFACQKQTPQVEKPAYPENEVPFSSTSDEAMQEFITGLNVLDEGNRQKAKPFFDKALALDADFVSAQMYRMQSSNSAKDFAENRNKFLAMRSKANAGEIILMDILLAEMEDDDVLKLKLSKDLVKKFPNSARACDNLARSYSAMNQINEARDHWKKAMKLNSDYLPAISNLGGSYIFNVPKDFKMAEKYMQMGVEKAPLSSRAQINLGDCYRAQNNMSKALASYVKASELDSEDQVALSKAGHANSFSGNFDAARKNFQNARTLSEFGTGSYNFEAYTYLYEGDSKKALAFLKEAATSVNEMDIPESNKTGAKMDCTFNSAMIAMHHGDLEDLKGVVELMKPLSVQIGQDIGSNAEVLYQKADMQYWDAMSAAIAGNYDEAVVISELIKTTLMSIKDPNKLRPYHRIHALVNYKQENFEKALAHAEKLNPDFIYDRYWMATTNKMAGNTDIAMEMYKEISDFNFNTIGYALVRNEVKELLATNTLTN